VPRACTLHKRLRTRHNQARSATEGLDPRLDPGSCRRLLFEGCPVVRQVIDNIRYRKQINDFADARVLRPQERLVEAESVRRCLDLGSLDSISKAARDRVG
jgi:hypothetical protein